MRKVPLGLAYLAGALKAHGIKVAAYNLNVDEDVSFGEFDWFGITVLTPFIPMVRELCEKIRAVNPSARIVVGGPHVTGQPWETLEQLPLADYAIVGEGEEALPRLVNGMLSGGLYWKDGCCQPLTRPDIHSIPYPDQRVFDHGNLEQQNPFRGFMTSRGCPYRCHNCQPILRQVQPYRQRRVSDVIAEMTFLQKTYGQTYFGIVDSEFPIKKSWLLEFHDELKRSGLEFSFHCNGRTDIIDEDILKIFKNMNITRLAMGVESGVQRVIDDVLHKDINLERTKDVFAMAEGMGIRTHAHMMIGIPGETLDDMRATLDYAENLRLSSVEFNMLTPWPGTEFHRICVENDWLVETDCSLYNEKRRSYVSTDKFTNIEVEEFYETIPHRLARWRQSDDGSVFTRN